MNIKKILPPNDISDPTFIHMCRWCRFQVGEIGKGGFTKCRKNNNAVLGYMRSCCEWLSQPIAYWGNKYANCIKL